MEAGPTSCLNPADDSRPLTYHRGVNEQARVAVLSVHTSPMDQPGTGDSGGLNVYVRAVAERLANRGVAVDLFTRCRGGVDHEVKTIAPGIRVVSVKAGPCAPMPKGELPRYLPEFLGGVLRVAHEDGRGYDIVHSHYWLSGWVGPRDPNRARRSPGGVVPHAGQGEELLARQGEAPESPERLAAEAAVIAEAERVLAPTPAEASQLVGLYGADPESVRLVPPGVDHTLFVPGDRARARERLHLAGCRLALFVGRLQPHKAPDVAVRTLAEAIVRDPGTAGDLVLAIVGGPSGPDKGAELARLMELASALGVSDRVMWFAPQPQSKLVDFYRAADVVLVPSRSESFGLVALEAQACGIPVIAADIGGLPYVVEQGRGGFLVDGHDPSDHADRLLQVLGDPGLQAALGAERTATGPALHLGRHHRPDGGGLR